MSEVMAGLLALAGVVVGHLIASGPMPTIKPMPTIASTLVPTRAEMGAGE